MSLAALSLSLGGKIWAAWAPRAQGRYTGRRVDIKDRLLDTPHS